MYICDESDAISPFLSPGVPMVELGTVFLTIGLGLVKFVVVIGELLLTIPLSANPVIPGSVDADGGAPALFSTTLLGDAVYDSITPQ